MLRRLAHEHLFRIVGRHHRARLRLDAGEDPRYIAVGQLDQGTVVVVRRIAAAAGGGSRSAQGLLVGQAVDIDGGRRGLRVDDRRLLVVIDRRRRTRGIDAPARHRPTAAGGIVQRLLSAFLGIGQGGVIGVQITGRAVEIVQVGRAHLDGAGRRGGIDARGIGGVGAIAHEGGDIVLGQLGLRRGPQAGQFLGAELVGLDQRITVAIHGNTVVHDQQSRVGALIDGREFRGVGREVGFGKIVAGLFARTPGETLGFGPGSTGRGFVLPVRRPGFADRTGFIVIGGVHALGFDKAFVDLGSIDFGGIDPGFVDTRAVDKRLLELARVHAFGAGVGFGDLGFVEAPGFGQIPLRLGGVHFGGVEPLGAGVGFGGLGFVEAPGFGQVPLRLGGVHFGGIDPLAAGHGLGFVDAGGLGRGRVRIARGLAALLRLLLGRFLECV